eukprot:SM000002S05501  [mRNA]  locus=s2:100972:102072:- [translate_table: standard]
MRLFIEVELSAEELPRAAELFHTLRCAAATTARQVLTHLTLKRSTSRMEVFAHAEAFAAVIDIGVINIAGAVTTILALLRKPENRCAAITMLGKTVELCLQQLTNQCNPELLAELATMLRAITEDVFQCNVTYIEESMGWTRCTLTRRTRPQAP